MAKILAVDDARTMRALISTILTNEGHEVISADDGTTAFELAKEDRVDLVITDLHMEEMNGIVLTQKLRTLDSYKSVPILLLTTEHGDNLKSEGRAAGASGWLNKPFNPPKLIKAVNKLLSI